MLKVKGIPPPNPNGPPPKGPPPNGEPPAKNVENMSAASISKKERERELITCTCWPH